MALASSGYQAGLLHSDSAREDIPLVPAFTNWCPMMAFLRKLGVEAGRGAVRGASN